MSKEEILDEQNKEKKSTKKKASEKASENKKESVVLIASIDLEKGNSYAVNTETGEKTSLIFKDKINIGLFVFGVPFNLKAKTGKLPKIKLEEFCSDDCTYIKYSFDTLFKINPIGFKNGLFWFQGRINGFELKHGEKICEIYL